MLDPEDEVLADAVAAEHRHPLWNVEADWTGTGQYADERGDLSDVVQSISIEASLTGDLPEETGQVDGFVSSTASVVLHGHRDGADEHIGRELSRYNPGGPREGKALVAPNFRVDLGLATEDGPRMVPRFEGYVRKLEFDEEDGTVGVEAVDPSELLRALITLPTYAEFITHIHRRSWPWKITVNTQWVLDYVTSANGIDASPPPREDAIIACSGHGGLVAERGFNGAPVSLYGDGPRTGLWVEDQNPWGMLGTPEGYNGGTVVYQEFLGAGTLRLAAGYGFGIGMWLHMSDSVNIPDPVSGDPYDFENRIIQVRPTENDYPRLFISGFGNGDLYMGVTTDVGQVYSTPRIPSGPDPWDFLGVHWEYLTNTLLRVTVRWNGATTVHDIACPDVSGHRVRPIVHVRGQCFRSWMLLQGWLAQTAPSDAEWEETAARDFEPQADIARGANELLYLPDVAARESWDVMRDAVAAEFGVQGFTAGRYSFRPRTDTRAETIDVELDVDANLLGASYTESAEAARNVVGYKTQAGYHSGEYQTVIEADDPEQFIVPMYSVREFDLDWPFGAANWRGGVLPYYASADWNADIVEGWTYSYEVPYPDNGQWTGGENPFNVEVYWTQVSNRTIRIRVNNTGSARIRLATPAAAANPQEQRGEGAMRIAGWPFVEPPEHVGEVRSQEAIDLHGHERALPLPDNEWRQHPEPLQPIASSILDALVEGPVVIEDLPIIGDPRVQPGDVARCWFRDVDVPLVGAVVKYRDDVTEDAGYDALVSVRPLPVKTLAPAGWTFYLDVSHHQGGADPLDLARVRGLGYAGIVARIGQGGGLTDAGDTHGEIADTWWTTWRDQALALWDPDLFAGYWYLGNVETPADQAARCASLMGDTSIPVMLDWEDGGGDWDNLLACIAAFRAEGLTVTMVYAARGYAGSHAPTGADLSTEGVALVGARYWTNDPAGEDPRVLWEDMPDGFGYEPFLGLTPSAHQFTQYGRVYSGQLVDVNSHPGDSSSLAAMFRGE